jgi:hypothetical protein
MRRSVSTRPSRRLRPRLKIPRTASVSVQERRTSAPAAVVPDLVKWLVGGLRHVISVGAHDRR